jgi:hypothetical protein
MVPQTPKTPNKGIKSIGRNNNMTSPTKKVVPVPTVKLSLGQGQESKTLKKKKVLNKESPKNSKSSSVKKMRINIQDNSGV